MVQRRAAFDEGLEHCKALPWLVLRHHVPCSLDGSKREVVFQIRMGVPVPLRHVIGMCERQQN